jgi:archaetidylinositol phosphate synthase
MKPVERIQQNLLAAAERRLLNWICARLPIWVTSDKLTALGFVGALACAAGYVLSNLNTAWLYMSIVGYFINWFGDSLDGSVARFRKQERPNYGYFIDHSLDALANTALIIGIGTSPFMRMDAAMFGLIGYLLMSIHTFISAKVMGEFRLSYLAGGPTELRILLIFMTIGMMVLGNQPVLDWPWGGEPMSHFDLFAVFMGAVLTTIFTVQTYRTGMYLRRIGG